MLTYPGAQMYVEGLFYGLRLEYALPNAIDTHDEPAGDFGIAHFHGIINGRGQLTFDNDRIPLRYTVTHECGHMLSSWATAKRGGDPFTNGLYDEFWAARGFPGTPMDSQLRALAAERIVLNSGYRYWPEEMFADTFGVVNTPFGFPITDQYGIWLDQDALRAFYKSLGEGDDMFTEADRALLQRVRDLLEAEGPKIWTARDQRQLDVERGQPFDPAKPPIDPRIKVT